MIDYKWDKDQISFYNDNFDPEHIFECGQAFRWTKEDDGSYTNVAFSRVINVSKEGNKIIIKNTNEEDFKNIWFDYFDLGTDYKKIMGQIPKTKEMEEAMDFGYGIRILNQDIFETIISFIISANNRIPMIKSSIKKIAENYGDLIGSYRGIDYYSFPTRDKLAQASPRDLREICRVGFRDERIVESSKLLTDPSFKNDLLKAMDTKDLRSKLMSLPGVGPKVGDCILLFAFSRSQVFPVDVWIQRVMEDLYIKEPVSKNKVDSYARSIFGKNAGYAQQYLFYYGRENSIGKKIK